MAVETVVPAAPVADAAPVTPVVAPTPIPEPAAGAPAPAEPPAQPPATPAVEAAPAAVPEPPKHEFAPSILEEGIKPPAPAEPEVKAPEPPKAVEEAKPKEAAPAEQPGPAEAAPVYEFTYPEGIKPEDINKERLDTFTATLGEHKFPKEAAQKLLDLHATEVREIANRVSENQWNVFARQQEQNKAIIRSDPEIGGAKFEASMRTCAAAIEQLTATPEERQAVWDAFRVTGAGNMLPVVKLLHRAGEMLAREGTPVVTPPPRVQPPSAQQRGLNRYKASGTPGA